MNLVTREEVVKQPDCPLIDDEDSLVVDTPVDDDDTPVDDDDTYSCS